MSKVDIHKSICNDLNKIYEHKNNDYGESFAKVRNELGSIAILVRLSDKLERLKTLMKGKEQQVQDESIKDSFRDLANYCIMELIEMSVDERGKEIGL